MASASITADSGDSEDSAWEDYSDTEEIQRADSSESIRSDGPDDSAREVREGNGATEELQEADMVGVLFSDSTDISAREDNGDIQQLQRANGAEVASAVPRPRTRRVQGSTLDPGLSNARNPQSTRFGETGSSSPSRYSNVQIADNSRVHVGNVYYDHRKFYTTEFGMTSLVRPGDRIDWNVHESRAFNQTSRQITPLPETPRYYAPYVSIADRRIRARLSQIAQRFQFLDIGFAEYFQKVMPFFGQDYAERLANNAHETIAKQHGSSSRASDATQSVDLGDLGYFCKRVVDQQDQPNVPPTKFQIANVTTESHIRYLQDGHEIPYYKFMLDMFLVDRTNSKSFSADVVLCVLNNTRLTILDEKRKLIDDLRLRNKRELEGGIEPIIKGIDARLAVLDNALDSEKSSLDQQDILDQLFESPQQHLPDAAEEITIVHTGTNDTVIFIGLLIFFVIGAIVPGYKAFSISMQTKAAGNTSDADFWYLAQNDIIAALSNLMAVIPLLRQSWLSPAYTLMWAFFGMGSLCAVISIAPYPLCNTGWSSMVSFFGSVASTASVLVMTLASAKAPDGAQTKGGEKIKRS